MSKLMIRIFNLVFIALSLAAIILLFTLPSFSFYSNIGIDVKKVSSFVPQTEYSSGIKIEELIGTDTIHVGIKFSLSVDDLNSARKNDRETINETLLEGNINDMVDVLHEPINLITEYMIRYILKGLIKAEIRREIKNGMTQAAIETGSTPDDIMEDIGLDDNYYTGFSDALYKSLNSDDSTVDSLTDTLYNQIDDALARADESGSFDSSSFDPSSKATVKNNLLQVFDTLKLVKGDGTIKKIGDVSYIYFAEFLKSALTDKVSDSSTLEQKSDETNVQYTSRLINLYVQILMPDAFYNIVSYISLGLFIGLFVFAGIWALLILITVLKTFTSRPWTFFGPLFWIAGLVEIVFGFGITIFFKFILPKQSIDLGSLPINSFVFAPRTYCLALSIIFIVVLVLTIPYTVFKVSAKHKGK